MSKTVAEAESTLAEAKTKFLSELEADAQRGDGSGAQERRREEHQQGLRNTVLCCEQDLEEARRLAGTKFKSP